MQRIKIIAVGKIKESFFRESLLEYQKRLSRYCKLEIVELTDEKIADKASLKDEEKIRDLEGQRIINALKDVDATVALCIEGEMRDSVAFANTLQQFAVQGKQTVAFVIGGSLGLSDAVKQTAQLKLSFSPMTFPHQLMRVVLLEQVYRGYKILGAETYHK
ncbi:MAG: 23S rRNA (pseudouridine(1915)-N(3))-methyltransferase RlmH [Hyphomonadaceae bacterium]|nr:23S rRNA (pseudouridine(1915)-N(3))-methyltransferase RlmH [Clostridia bacterium]